MNIRGQASQLIGCCKISAKQNDTAGCWMKQHFSLNSSKFHALQIQHQWTMTHQDTSLVNGCNDSSLGLSQPIASVLS
jgi:hypothetical protein